MMKVNAPARLFLGQDDYPLCSRRTDLAELQQHIDSVSRIMAEDNMPRASDTHAAYKSLKTKCVSHRHREREKESRGHSFWAFH